MLFWRQSTQQISTSVSLFLLVSIYRGTQHRSVSTNPVLGSPIVQSIANKHGRSTAEVVLSWALQKGMSVIPRSSNQQHIQQLARLLGDNPGFLDETDMQQVDSMKDTI